MDKFSIRKHGNEWILPYSQSSMFLSDEDVGELYVFIGSIYWRIFDGE
jgi:hypothetical protein